MIEPTDEDICAAIDATPGLYWSPTPVREADSDIAKSIFAHATTLAELRTVKAERDALQDERDVAQREGRTRAKELGRCMQERNELRARLADAEGVLAELAHTAGAVHNLGAQTGSQWFRLGGSLISARAFLAQKGTPQ